MAYKFPEGGKFLFSNTFATAKPITSATNANPVVINSVGHGYIDDDELLVSCNWEDATDSVFRANQLTVDTLSLLGLDTSSTNLFTAGGGDGGTMRKIINWVEVPQVLTIATTGGDVRSATINPVFRRNGINRPLGFNPTVITLELAHDASLTAYQQMLAISRVFGLVAFKQLDPDGSASYGYGYMNVSETPRKSAGNPNAVTAVFSAQGRSISY